MRCGVFGIRDRRFKNMVACVACIELKNVQELINAQPGFFLEFSSGSSSDSFASFYLATRQNPFRLRFSNEQDMPISLAYDGSSDFHLLTRKVCH